MEPIDEKTKKLVMEEFKKLQNPVKLIFFTQEMECGYCKDAHQLIAQLAALDNRISFEAYELLKNQEMAKKYGIERIPALVILAGEDDFGFRYYGLPSGYEFSVMISMIVIASKRDSGLLQKWRDDLKKIINEMEIKIFVLPTCPHCPAAALAAGRFAFENRNIKVNIIESAEYPQLVQKYGVIGTPKVVINETISFDGALPEPLFIQYLLHAQEHVLEKGPSPVGTA